MTIHFLNTETTTLTECESNFDHSILQNICVTAPYLALTNYRYKEEYIFADFTTELINITEVGPICGAEVGRHLAILGSVVLAKENPRKERHYYLATKAVISRLSPHSSTDYALTACAKLISINRKQGIIEGYILDKEGSKLFQIRVTYMVLLKSIFERMFVANRVETPLALDYNPYAMDVNFDYLHLDVQSCYASIGIVKKEQCIGHFANFPALPVARLATAMEKLGGLHFMHLNPSSKKKFVFKTADVNANQLVFVGEEVKLRTEIVDLTPELGMVIRTIAYTNSCDIVAETICNYHY